MSRFLSSLLAPAICVLACSGSNAGLSSSTNQGGAGSTGGATSSGGATSAGGAMNTGGKSASGDASGSGASTSTGGSTSLGGAGGTTGPSCSSDGDCPQRGCYMCAATKCVNGQCVIESNPGAGGSSSGGAGNGGSPGSVSIEFSVTGSTTYCMTSMCGEGPVITIESHTLTQACSDRSCDTCQMNYGAPGCGVTQCPASRGIPVEGASLTWNGLYFNEYIICPVLQGDAPCLEPAYAQPGKYTAKFCAIPGTLSGADGGLETCVPTGPLKCATVDFEFPSTAPVKGVLGP